MATAMSDEQLRIDIEDELLWEPRVDDAGIEVSVDRGIVTLGGRVPSVREQREATKAAKRVYGVKRIHDELRVELPPGARRADRKLRKSVLQALEVDSVVPAFVDATVHKGFVMLTGSVSYEFERDEAEAVTANVAGVIGIDNAIRIAVTSAPPEDVEEWIRGALRRDVRLDPGALFVSCADGTVTLSGIVGSWPEHDAAIHAAWAAPGVALVDDRIAVSY
jgi:osmotically-inducible protein OsmY